MITNRYPIWKYIAIVIVLLLGLVYALPNVYGEDPAVQLSYQDDTFNSEQFAQVESILKINGIDYTNSKLEDNRVFVRFADTETQLKARDILTSNLGDDYTVALYLAAKTPAWLTDLGAKPMNLGLDLRGGVYFLLEVDLESAFKQSLEGYVDGFRKTLRENKLRNSGTKIEDNTINVKFSNEQTRDEALKVISRDNSQDLFFDKNDEEGVFSITAKLSEAFMRAETTAIMSQNIVTLRNRTNELGVTEPVVQRQGQNRIVVQMPGVQDPSKVKSIIDSAATLEYRMVHGGPADWSSAERSGRAPLGTKLYKQRDGLPILLKNRVIVSGDNVQGANATFDDGNRPAVSVTLDGKGATRMGDNTSKNIGKPMAVVYIDYETDTRIVNGEQVKTTRRVEEVISVATIQGQFSKRFQTTGLDQKEANDLALLLRSGSLRAPMEIVEERTIGPSLGADNIAQGFQSVVYGLALVLIFMLIYYKLFGLTANAALFINTVLIVAVLSLLQATLTLPGIAGIVLTIGMAVDANVLIFERIREELRTGKWSASRYPFGL